MNTGRLKSILTLAMTFWIGAPVFGAALPPFYANRPGDVVATGNSASNLNGRFQMRGSQPVYQIFLGTEQSGGVGALVLNFDRPFEDGPGGDFALVTGTESWGPQATKVLVQFFLGEKLQTSMIRHMWADAVFAFEMPLGAMVANRVVITNISPDPPGINDEATMSFVDAGVSYVVRPRTD